MPSPIHVTCGIVLWNNKVLCVQRSEDMHLPFKWEFPGGKIEKGEDAPTCLLREIKEELNLAIEIMEYLSPVFFQYPGKQPICLIPMIASCRHPRLTLSEHAAFVWLEPKNILTLDWAEADIPIVKEFINWWDAQQRQI
ncbi:(deoxy)nucleoside triphosphate pyrophosphohydrolase [Mongoliitalea daihaiensis]|uniref:(deoxy)nucleoside triphosphate pyrophosphohydrolase n=1 Tax=Mongoliitalea daihaiensis TaxID=2782006 RepID=UPI001F3469EE|nr:(deoxy)nucleoside triphosphate pyrophosphohydrolase [Mongoliitalea daihaiensis]UJP63657.1 (deoxy)nucleoside triphosphate pyrophosphohydrolase [Mongoliitalea daihaiensis]